MHCTPARRRRSYIQVGPSSNPESPVQLYTGRQEYIVALTFGPAVECLSHLSCNRYPNTP